MNKNYNEIVAEKFKTSDKQTQDFLTDFFSKISASEDIEKATDFIVPIVEHFENKLAENSTFSGENQDSLKQIAKTELDKAKLPEQSYQTALQYALFDNQDNASAFAKELISNFKSLKQKILNETLNSTTRPSSGTTQANVPSTALEKYLQERKAPLAGKIK